MFELKFHHKIKSNYWVLPFIILTTFTQLPTYSHINNKNSKQLIGNWLGNIVNSSTATNYEMGLNIKKNRNNPNIQADLSLTDLVNSSQHYIEIDSDDNDNDNVILKDIAFEILCGKPKPGSILVTLLPTIHLRLAHNQHKLIGSVMIDSVNYSIVLTKQDDDEETIKSKSPSKVSKKDAKSKELIAKVTDKNNPNRLARPIHKDSKSTGSVNAKPVRNYLANRVNNSLNNDTNYNSSSNNDTNIANNSSDDISFRHEMFPNNYWGYDNIPSLREKNNVREYAKQNTSSHISDSENSDNSSYSFENGVLKASVKHNVSLPPVPDYLKAGVKYDESILKSKKLTRLWYRIPDWLAGTWLSKSQRIINSSYPFLNNSQGIAEQEGCYGYEVDKLSHIWSFMMLPAYLDINANNNEPVVVHSIIFYFKPLKLESRKFVTMIKVYQVYVRKSDNIIEQTVQHESINTDKYINENTYQVISSNKWFDGQGKPTSVDTRESYSYRQKPFKEITEMPLAKELREDFINYLNSHGLSNLVPKS